MSEKPEESLPHKYVVMDAKTLFSLLKPHLESMEAKEKKSLFKLITGMKGKSLSARRRKVLSLEKAKEKLKLFRSMEQAKEQRA